MVDGGHIPADLTSKGSMIYEWDGAALHAFQSLDNIQSVPVAGGGWNRSIFS